MTVRETSRERERKRERGDWERVRDREKSVFFVLVRERVRDNEEISCCVDDEA